MPKPIHMGSRLRDYLKPFLRNFKEAQVRKNFIRLCKGLLQSQKTILSEAARSVNRMKGKTKGTYFYRERIDDWVKKMSNFLGDLRWDVLMPFHYKRVRSLGKDFQLIVHDGSDMNKRWAEEMEGLSIVRDGSTKELVNGYHLFCSIGVGKKAWENHPIDVTLVNPKSPEFTCVADVEKSHIRRMLGEGIGLHCMHLFDRGYDDQKWFSFLDAELDLWMVRMTQKRNVLFRDERGCPITLVAATLLNESTLNHENLKYAFEKVWITLEYDENGEKHKTPQVRQYTLVVIEDPKKQEPMMLLTNAEVKSVKKSVGCYFDYLKRWEIEDYFRFLKQCFDVESMQLMKFNKLQSFLRLLMILSDFVLREYHKGRDPLEGGLYEIIKSSYVHSMETYTESPYVISKAISELLNEEQQNHEGEYRPQPTLKYRRRKFEVCPGQLSIF